MKSHTKTADDRPSENPGAFVLLRDRPLEAVKKWAVRWGRLEAPDYTLIGPLDFAIDLGDALHRWMLSDDCEIGTLAVWPCIVGTPKQVYFHAKETVQRLLREDDFRANAQYGLASFGFTLPHPFELDLLRQSKAVWTGENVRLG